MAQSQRNVLFGVVGAIAFLLAAYFFYSGAREPLKIPNQFQTHGVCLACKAEVDVSYPSGQVAPFKCPSCGDEAVYPLYYCTKCRHRCVPILDRSNPNEPPRLPTVPLVPVCSFCQSHDLMAFIPGMIPQSDIVGDAPLPKWP